MGRHDEDAHGESTLPSAVDAPTVRRVLIVTLDTLSPQMAGPAIRAWNLAEQLSQRHEVVLASPKPVRLPPGLVDVRHVDERRLEELVDWCEVIVFQGFAMEQFPVLGAHEKVVVVDAYAPLYLEQLEQARSLGPAAHAHVVDKGVTTLNEQLARADFVMCASEKQRDLYLGTLGALGRINPHVYLQDPSLRSLIDVVPFGLPSVAPEHRHPALKGVVPGIGEEDRVVLWGGGIYNWFDPLTLIRAVHRVRLTRPEVKLFFLGLIHPNPDVEEMEMARRARLLADELDMAGTSVFFNESWVPYDRRGDYLLEADIGVSTHNDHVESNFAFRTRVLDYLWAGLPMVLTEGDALADLVRQAGAGVTVGPGDVEALTQALLQVLEPEQARRHRECAAQAAKELTWAQVIAPLERAVDAAAPAADRAHGSAALRSAAPRTAPGTVRSMQRDLALVRGTLATAGPRALLPPLRRRLSRRTGR